MLPRLFSTVTAARLTTIQYLPLQDLLHTPHLHLRTYVLSSIPTGPLSLRNLTEYIKVDPGCRSYYRWRLEMDNAAKTRKSHFVKPQDSQVGGITKDSFAAIPASGCRYSVYAKQRHLLIHGSLQIRVRYGLRSTASVSCYDSDIEVVLAILAVPKTMPTVVP
ncbi:hypothetical protein KC339_g72 [Hortaea werneckii]|nr:hypothetical protein KC339_g72 [Hortaea werneckii]